MSVDTKSSLFMIVVWITIAALAVGILIGSYSGYDWCRQQAIKNNAGRWLLVNERTGETKWEWTGRVP